MHKVKITVLISVFREKALTEMYVSKIEGSGSCWDSYEDCRYVCEMWEAFNVWMNAT